MTNDLCIDVARRTVAAVFIGLAYAGVRLLRESGCVGVAAEILRMTT